MIHGEIASGIYNKLKRKEIVIPGENGEEDEKIITGISVPVFKFFSNQSGSRVVIQVKANVQNILQTAQVWLVIYSTVTSGIANFNELETIQHEIEEEMEKGNITLPSGEIVYFEPMSVDGPYIDGERPQEVFSILRYKIKAYKGGLNNG